MSTLRGASAKKADPAKYRDVVKKFTSIDIVGECAALGEMLTR